jgi:hypothetical protein
MNYAKPNVATVNVTHLLHQRHDIGRVFTGLIELHRQARKAVKLLVKHGERLWRVLAAIGRNPIGILREHNRGTQEKITLYTNRDQIDGEMGEQQENTLAVMALIGSIKMALLNIFDIMSAIILSMAPCNWRRCTRENHITNNPKRANQTIKADKIRASIHCCQQRHHRCLRPFRPSAS